MTDPAEQTDSEGGVRTVLHRDGTGRGRGPVVDGVEHGYWEWFRLDGTLMRSGSFDHGAVTGEWVTYDAHGVPYKVTDRTPKG